MRPAIALLLVATLACRGQREPPSHPPEGTESRPSSEKPKPLEGRQPVPNRIQPVDRDLAAVQQNGEIAILFTFNSTGYFMYRGETMGYEYELLSLFAHEQKLKLKPVLVRDSRRLFEQLDRGEGDVIAAQLAAGRDQSQVALTDVLYETAPVVVQRKGEDPTVGMTPTVKRAVKREEKETVPSDPIEIRGRLISKPSELAGQQVHLAQSSPYYQRIIELNEELTNDVIVVEVDETIDRLIQRLAEGDIEYTVAPENVAALRTGEYKNLLIKPALGPPEPVVWGVRTNAPLLRQAINKWIDEKRKEGLLAILYKKYFQDRKAYRRRVLSRYLTGETGRLSPYDDFFREYARILGWDWRLVASQAYQESHFNPEARSWAGAIGVMQIMPRTARELRVNPADPRQSIEGACRYLWKLDQRWKDDISNEAERIKFILGSYNAGLGHVEDARRLAEKFGDNPDSWNDVAYWLIRKSKRTVYNDPVVKYGFVRGTEPVAYVDLILDRYAHYKLFVPAGPGE